MSRPQFCIEITGGEDASCLGKQLLHILEMVEPFLGNVTWYGADIDILGNGFVKYARPADWIPKKIGAFKQMYKMATEVNQFLSGVFLALSKDVGDIYNLECGTEDDSFRDMGEAILEIRAFDTSYFEVYSNDITCIQELSRRFRAVILYANEEAHAAKNVRILQSEASKEKSDLSGKPRYLVKLRGEKIDCSGTQLKEILLYVKDEISTLIWYGSDIQSDQNFDTFKSSYPKKIGTFNEMIDMAQSIQQFRSGVFLGFEKSMGDELQDQYTTNDKEFSELGDALLEIRAFNQDYFVIYTKDYDLIRKIAKKFYGIVNYNIDIGSHISYP